MTRGRNRSSANRPASRRRKINFGAGVTWTAVSNAYDEMTVDNPVLSLDVRLLAAARARLGVDGHAHWRRGELRARLKIVQKSGARAGEIHTVERSTLLRAIQRLVDAGAFLPGSSPECLVYAPFAVQTAHDARTLPCPRGA